MDERTQQPNTPQPTKKEKPPKKKPGFLVRVVLFLIALVMVLIAVALVAFRDTLNLDSLKRWFTYRTLVLSDSGQAAAFRYDGELTDTFTVLDGDLLVCSKNAISLYSGSGTQYVSQPVALDNPVVDANGSLAVVYDAGGSDLYILGQRSLIWSVHDLDSILAAHLNRNGQLTVVTQASGYRGAVTVYDNTYAPVVSVRLSSAFVMDAALSDDGRTLAILTIGQQSGNFTSTLELYTLNSAAGTADQAEDFTPGLTADLGGNVILALRHTAEDAARRAALLEALSGASPGDVVLLHGCCHNPTGADLDAQQWKAVTRVVAERGLIPFLDIAYQGFGNGLDADAEPVRLFAESGQEFLVASSFSK